MTDINKSIEEFKILYNSMNRVSLNIHSIKAVYDDNIQFEDCFHSINGISNLYDYFESLYSNVTFIEFSFLKHWYDDTSAVITWNMSYQHPKLNQGNLISVQGASELTFFEGKIIKHRDYFDAGSMLYEHIPLLRRIILFLKNRMA